MKPTYAKFTWALREAVQVTIVKLEDDGGLDLLVERLLTGLPLSELTAFVVRYDDSGWLKFNGIALDSGDDMTKWCGLADQVSLMATSDRVGEPVRLPVTEY